jgi:tetratricopeptide (TPR) repeat protein
MGMRCVGLICLVMMAPVWRAGAAELKKVVDGPPDAAALMKRGTAYAARNDFKDALPDLEKACELAPREPDYFYELGRVQWQSGHSDLALQAFDRSIELKPDDVPALLARARLRFNDHARSKEDLDTIDRIVAPGDDLRLEVGLTYDAIGELPAAIHQYDLWLDAHLEGGRRALALDARCRAQAEADQNLDRALKDCNEALMRLDSSAAIPDNASLIRPHVRENPDILASRGLVWLRRGEFDRAIKDYDDAVAERPKVAEYRFARGLARLRAGRQAQGQADIAAAIAMQKDIAERFAAWGLKP